MNFFTDRTNMIQRILSGLKRRLVHTRSMRRRTSDAALPEILEARQLLAATAIQAFHRSGQTFITWTEDGAVTGEGYHVYRSNAPITTANIGSAQKLTAKWGALDDQTSVHKFAATGASVPTRFVINDLATPLADNKGLFVFTTPDGSSGTWYYAVTQVTNGTESLTLTAGQNTLSTGVTEQVATPQPVLTVSTNAGKGRIYTQYMDYANWNPTFQGYAYNYAIALPENYDPNVAWPLKLMPHAYGERMRFEPVAEFSWPCIELFLDDSGGGTADRFQTWWYGFAADHNYQTNGSIPTSGVVENFTEQRILKAVDEVSALFNVDQQMIHSQGHSMGASGSLSLGMRYGNVFSGIYASEPMTDYTASPNFQTDFTVLWGSQASNLPIVNRGSYATPLTQYNGTGIYDWMDHPEQLALRRGETMAFLMVGHGKADNIIDWATQGQPFIAALNAANVGYTAEMRGGWDHNWMGFSFAQDAMFSPSIGELGDWVYPKNMSFPGISLATGSGPNVPGNTGTNTYNMNIQWATPWNTFDASIVDTVSRYEISLRSVNGATQQAEVTPQRLQAFTAPAGTVVNWQNIDNDTGAVVQSGSVTSDADGLVVIPRMQIGTGTGNRLILTASAPKPTLTGPAATTSSQTPTVTWGAVAGALSYDVWIQNLSTGVNPAVQANVATTNFTPATALGIGKFRVWVRARFANNAISAWSTSRDFTINTAPVITTQTSPIPSGTPLLAWSNLAGAAKYDLWISNITTGQSQFIRQQALTQNSYQVTTNLGVGTYQMWVRGIDASGLAAGWSSVWQFSTAAAGTAVSPNTPGFAAQPQFVWQTVPFATTYTIFVQNRATGATVLNQTGRTGTTWTPGTTLAKGDYRWWVRGVSATGVLGSWSAPKDFNVGGKPIVLSPTGTTNSQPQFSWSAVQGAASYQIWVSRLDVPSVVINQSGLTNTTYNSGVTLAAGSYRVWVRAVSTGGVISDWSTYVDFTVAALPESSESLELAGLNPLVTQPILRKARVTKKTSTEIAPPDLGADQIQTARVEYSSRTPEASPEPESDEIDQAMIMDWAV
ncbi:MAG: hypothetical protein JNM43_25475 [Planctomycetaceae bacterium]|nr:hypothetical protein [Planctomycetaceae bacterium]